MESHRTQIFPHQYRAMQGVVVVFSRYLLVKEVMDKTTTDTGLKVQVRINTKDYPIGSKTAKYQMDYQHIPTFTTSLHIWEWM